MAEQVDYRALLQEVLAKAVAEIAASPSDAFGQGLRAGYYDLVSFALDEGAVLGITPADLGLDGIDAAALLRASAPA